MSIQTIDLQSWTKKRIKFRQIEKYLRKGKHFLDQAVIMRALAGARSPDKYALRDILQKSLHIQSLTLQETAALLQVVDPELLQEMRQVAFAVKRKVYDKRIVTFAPLYLGNFCVNDCLYCGFRSSNSGVRRAALSLDDITSEVSILAGRIGHKRLIVVYGEHPLTYIDYMVDSISQIYQVRAATKSGFAGIRRVNVNAPPLSIEELKKLKAAGIGTYQVFQETYHQPTYITVHPSGTVKNDYLWRLYAMHRAFEAGIDDVGLGALFGLYDWKYELMGLVCHNRELEATFGVGAHTVSFPRLEPAVNTPYTQTSKYKVNDEDFKRLITVLRLAIPHAGMIITCRETPSLKRQALYLGITQTDASTRIGIGSYSDQTKVQEGRRQQFFIADTRSLQTMIQEFCRLGFITSFCTAGYRCGRTGKCIMQLLRSGKEGVFCKLNAVLTFREWLDDFATEETKKIAEPVITREIEEIKNNIPEVLPQFMQYYRKVIQGERDLYF